MIFCASVQATNLFISSAFAKNINFDLSYLDIVLGILQASYDDVHSFSFFLFKFELNSLILYITGNCIQK